MKFLSVEGLKVYEEQRNANQKYNKVSTKIGKIKNTEHQTAQKCGTNEFLKYFMWKTNHLGNTLDVSYEVVFP